MLTPVYLHFAYLDRVNVGFLHTTMNKALGFSSAVYGFGGGIFSTEYFIFEVPSKIRRGSRCPHLDRADYGYLGTDRRLYRVHCRTAIILFDPLCPRHRRGGLLSGHHLVFNVVVSVVLPLPHCQEEVWRPQFRSLSTFWGLAETGALLNLDGWLGLAGWQWLFILEAAPAVVLGVAFWIYMTDWPSDAHWLQPAQRDWLIARLDTERARRESIKQYSLKQALLDKRVLLLSLVYFGGTFSGYGIVLFQPQIVHRLAEGFGMTGVINAIPYVFAAVAMILWGRHSDHTGERPRHVAIAYAVGAIGLIATALMTDPVLTMITLVIAAMGQASTGPTFWSLPTAMLSGTAAAGGIALINALGNLGGFFGPYVFGLIKDATGGSFMFCPDEFPPATCRPGSCSPWDTIGDWNTFRREASPRVND